MFRDDTVTSEKFIIKFKILKSDFEKKTVIGLDSEYHKELQKYIERLYTQTVSLEFFTQKNFDDIRELEMSNLNRLQKIKNSSSYKKDKHKSRSKNEDWG